jgi:hypothetical protein
MICTSIPAVKRLVIIKKSLLKYVRMHKLQDSKGTRSLNRSVHAAVAAVKRTLLACSSVSQLTLVVLSR